jgi:hypothetical protein
MALKVSDEFTVPLCTTHHDQLHRTGDERAFWINNSMSEPLKHAARLWKLSHQKGGTSQQKFDPDTEQEFSEPSLRRPFRQILSNHSDSRWPTHSRSRPAVKPWWVLQSGTENSSETLGVMPGG